MFNENPELIITSLDKQIWDEELENFVPKNIFDVHTHIYKWSFNKDPKKDIGERNFQGKYFSEVSMRFADQVDQLLMPNRVVNRLSFPFPFKYPCNFEGSNEYILEQTKTLTENKCLILINPNMDKNYIEELLLKNNIKGFKPYRFYSKTNDTINCKILDFITEEQIEIADKFGLIIMMHLAKKDAIADDDNINDLIYLSDKYPNVKWILAHCARSYSAWALEKGIKRIRDLKNIWYDCSTVCESDSIEALYQGVGLEKIMYGSDDMIGRMRGKYITFGKAWSAINSDNHNLALSHCDDRMTFIRYEQLRAMKRGIRNSIITESEKQDLFYNNAKNLIDSVNPIN